MSASLEPPGWLLEQWLARSSDFSAGTNASWIVSASPLLPHAAAGGADSSDSDPAVASPTSSEASFDGAAPSPSCSAHAPSPIASWRRQTAKHIGTPPSLARLRSNRASPRKKAVAQSTAESSGVFGHPFEASDGYDALGFPGIAAPASVPPDVGVLAALFSRLVSSPVISGSSSSSGGTPAAHVLAEWHAALGLPSDTDTSSERALPLAPLDLRRLRPLVLRGIPSVLRGRVWFALLVQSLGEHGSQHPLLACTVLAYTMHIGFIINCMSKKIYDAVHATHHMIVQTPLALHA